VQGLTGDPGSPGAPGAAGATGPQGPPGPTGPGVVSTTVIAGFASALVNAPGVCDGQDGMAFFGVTASVVIDLHQVAQVSATANLGAGSGGGGKANLSLNICYQSPVQVTPATPTGFISDFDYLQGLQLSSNSFIPMTLTRAFPLLAPGTYTFGMCGCVDGADAWVTDYSWLTINVYQP
jgi:hypothetical protein